MLSRKKTNAVKKNACMKKFFEFLAIMKFTNSNLYCSNP